MGRRAGNLLAEIAQRLRHGVSQMWFETERDLLLVMRNEVAWQSEENKRRTGWHGGARRLGR